MLSECQLQIVRQIVFRRTVRKIFRINSVHITEWLFRAFITVEKLKTLEATIIIIVK